MRRKILGMYAESPTYLVDCTSKYIMYINVHLCGRASTKMKRTEERIADDDAFVRLFRPALQHAYDEAKREKKSDQEFAESIGVDRPQMLRILEEGAMPSVRTVAFAYREYGISVP